MSHDRSNRASKGSWLMNLLILFSTKSSLLAKHSEAKYSVAVSATSLARLELA